ncbi:type IV pilin [Halobacteriales archaeon QS_4_66_20]|nr:MAG: type IV pilin [Halobacteriales archaeon QS_4_66_20]
MRFKQLLTDDDAVSPVIGVILMVAITVILAAVIASFVLGLGDQNNPAPTADFNFDWDNGTATSDDGSLTITHGDGDELDATQVYVRGDYSPTGDQDWQTLSTSPSSPSTVAAGDSIEIGGSMASDYTINVVWEDPDSDTTSTLSTDRGPDA